MLQEHKKTIEYNTDLSLTILTDVIVIIMMIISIATRYISQELKDNQTLPYFH